MNNSQVASDAPSASSTVRVPCNENGGAPGAVFRQWSQTTVFWAISGGIGLWLAFPCWGVWPLGWLAPACWVWLIRQPRLEGKRPYQVLYLAGLLHWLLVIHWIRLPHWSAYFGWLALSIYLGAYLPVFVGISRLMVHRWRWSVVAAAPVVWCGLELVRAYLLTGFSMALLGHTQMHFAWIIQIADLFGAYGIGFVMILFSAAVARTFPLTQSSFCLWPLGIGVAGVAATMAYGVAKLQDASQAAAGADSIRIGLVQGSIDTTFDGGTDPRDTFAEYLALSRQLITQQEEPLDLVVWPESMFTFVYPWVEFQKTIQPVEGIDAAQTLTWVQQAQTASRDKAKWVTRELGTSLLAGSESLGFGDHAPHRYNSALWFAADGSFQGRYDKMHPVMFGEYVPLGNWFPWLYRLTPMDGGLESGTAPLAVQMDQITLSPSICYENTIPQLIRRQVRTLSKQGHRPDALVTVSNDGWFWGSSELDMHLACGVFRAVELRRPMLIAANTGFSAWIDASGKIVEQGPRRATGTIVAEIAETKDDSIYYRYGDTIPGICLLLCIAAVVGEMRRRLAPL